MAAAAKQHKDKPKVGPLSYVYPFLVYTFLYLPMVMVVLYSVNKNNNILAFHGFS